MMRHRRLEHRFVQHIPERLDPGVLYISMEYATATHSCCCGCGEEVVTPLTPTDWRITFDGETVSLRPSVGSWTLPCRSHYLIDHGRVVEAEGWTDERVAAARHRDRAAKSRHYRAVAPSEGAGPSPNSEPVSITLGQRLWRWFGG